MKVDPYLHAVLVLKGADKEIKEESVKAVLKAIGVTPDDAKVKVVCDAVKDVNWEEALAAPVMAGPAAAAPAAEHKAEKKEEKKEEGKTEEEAAAGLAGLFG